MLLRDLRQQMLLPRLEYEINQRAETRGLEVQVLSFTIGTEQNSLWVAYREDMRQETAAADWDWPSTNRQELLRNIAASAGSVDFQLTEMVIQGQSVRFGSSRSHRLGEMNTEGLMQLQHFAELGLLPAEWDDLNLESIVIAQFQQSEEESAPELEMVADLSVTLHVGRTAREIAVQLPFRLPLGKQGPGVKVAFPDPLTGEERYFFVDEVCTHDVYQDVFANSQPSSAAMPKQARRQLMRALENVCPPDKVLAAIKYETPDDVQLRFMLRGYLQQEPARSNSGVIFGSSSGQTAMGVNGHRLRECVLQPVDKGFGGELELELFSLWVNVPGEVVNCTSR